MKVVYKRSDRGFTAAIEYQDNETRRYVVLGHIHRPHSISRWGFFANEDHFKENFGYDVESFDRKTLKALKAEIEARLWIAIFGRRNFGVPR